MRALTSGQRAVSLTKLQSALDSKNSYAAEVEAARGLRKVDDVLRESLETLVGQVMAVAGNATGSELPLPPVESGGGVTSMRTRLQPPTRFDKTNPDAVEWAANYASDSIRDITAESRAAINRVIAQRLASGASTRNVAKVIQMSVGLTERHAAAVLNLADRLANSPGKVVKAGTLVFRVPPTGLTDKKIQEALAKYATRLTKVRAQNIARTATRTASSEGQRQMWRQAREKGLLTGQEKRQWIASSNSCPMCAALDGETATLEGRFPGGFAHPPAHGSCTCTQALTYD